MTIALLVTACVPSAPVKEPELSASDDLLAAGSLSTTQAGTDLGFAIRGQVRIISQPEATLLRLAVRSGLGEEGTEYPAHVHNAACADGAGGHYQRDPTAAPGEDNEIWLPVTSNGEGGIGTAVIPEGLRPDARSIVVHEPVSKAKIACADIVLVAAGGGFTMLPDGVGLGFDIQGFAVMISSRSRTQTWVVVMGGLEAGTTYPTHVHDGACADGGGAHYQIDPTAAAGEENEIWPTLSADEAGRAFATVRTPAAIRLNAQSVVIHEATTKARIACADLD